MNAPLRPLTPLTGPPYTACVAADPFHTRAGEAFLAELEALDVNAGGEADPELLGRQAAQVVASDLLWRRQLGGLLDLGEVRVRLGGVSRQAVHGRRLRRTLLAVPDPAGDGYRYPAFQFRGRAGLRNLAPILMAFDGAVETPWTVASWLTSPHEALDGRSPAECLADGHSAEEIADLARRSAERLRQ